MAQVFANLLNNSAKYTQAGGQIEIGAECSANEVVVTVRDNGIGISADSLSYIFDMFRQVDQSLERAQGGLGIGLTLVRRLVELHGGSIQIHSDGPGKGSAFITRLPLAAVELPQQPASPMRDVSRSKRRFLVVDDNKDVRDMLSLLLQAKGHDVRKARDGSEAIEVAETFLPEVILMDVGMPNLNGYEAAGRIRQLPRGNDPFIVALTGWGQPDDVRRSREAGCSAHMVKPVNMAELERMLMTWESDKGASVAEHTD
jgi:CheY-like chemotaxis protein